MLRIVFKNGMVSAKTPYPSVITVLYFRKTLVQSWIHSIDSFVLYGFYKKVLFFAIGLMESRTLW